MHSEGPINCKHCGAPIGERETLCCQTHNGTIVASGYLEIRRLLGGLDQVEVFHLRCVSTEMPPSEARNHD
jgi:hypothetical protein